MTTYILMGNKLYYDMIRINVEQLSRIAPRARVLVYDWGDGDRPCRFIPPDTSLNIDVIDWRSRISDVSTIEATTTPAQRLALAIGFNARHKRNFSQRMKKAVLKHLPDSRMAKPLIRAGLVFENMLMQKVPCMIDASRRTGADSMVFLDADAFLVRPVEDDVFSRAFDVAVTLNDSICWDYDRCGVVNSGVIFFQDTPKRDIFLDAWWQAIGTCHEWLREQTALTRLMERQTDRSAFGQNNKIGLALNGHSLDVLMLPCRTHNNLDFFTVTADDAPFIAHAANTVHNEEWRSRIRQRLETLTNMGQARGNVPAAAP